MTLSRFGPEEGRYERNDSPDLDNIIKPIIDGLKISAGCLYDDCQVQIVQASWIDIPRYDSPRIQLSITPYHRDDVMASEAPAMLQVAPTLCVPSTYYSGPALRSSWAAGITEAFERPQAFIEEFGEASSDAAEMLRPIQRLKRPFARARVADFEVLDPAACRDETAT